MRIRKKPCPVCHHLELQAEAIYCDTCAREVPTDAGIHTSGYVFPGERFAEADFCDLPCLVAYLVRGQRPQCERHGVPKHQDSHAGYACQRCQDEAAAKADRERSRELRAEQSAEAKGERA